jgi:hypothetical protein
MCLSVLQDPRFYEFLFQIDRDLAADVGRRGCRYCGAALHSARYPRKPRGGPQELPSEQTARFSFCCSADGCRRRHTPPSVRFLGRQVFLAAAVVLITAMRQGPTPRGRRELSRLFQVSPRTLSRWRVWWRDVFPDSAFWRRMRARFLPPILEADLPGGLLDRFQGQTVLERCLLMLKWLSPISSPCALMAGAF